MDSKLEGFTRREVLLLSFASCANLGLGKGRLQERLEGELERRLHDDEKAGLIVATEEQRYAQLRPDEAMQCASLVKVPIANAYLHEVSKGRQRLDACASWWLKTMIELSSNQNTNRIIERMGGPEKVQEILTQNFPQIYHNTHIVEEIPKGGRTYLNKASVSDYDRLINAIWNGQIPYSRLILSYMARAHGERRVRGQIPRSAHVYHKGGTTALLYGAMAAVDIKTRHGRKHYNFILVIEKANRPKTETEFYTRARIAMQDAATITYRHMQRELEG